MDEVMNDAPAFVYLKGSSISLILNKHGQPIVFIDDRAEMNWLFNWVSNYGRHRLKALPRAVQSKETKKAHFPHKQHIGGVLRYLNKSPRVIAGRKQPRIADESGDGLRQNEGKSAHKKGGRKRQLIGEQIGATRILQLRLFQTQQEAEQWTREGVGRRFRFATIGSVGWTRALDEEMKLLQQVQCVPVLSSQRA